MTLNESLYIFNNNQYLAFEYQAFINSCKDLLPKEPEEDKDYSIKSPSLALPAFLPK